MFLIIYFITNRQQLSTKINLDKLWIDKLFLLQPTRSFLQNRFYIEGVGGLYKIMTSTKGLPNILKMAFLEYCLKIDSAGLGRYCDFVVSCFYFRDCQDKEVRRFW